MKINYVPGLPLRLFPQNSRDPYTAFKTFTQSNCDFVLMTGNCPDTDKLWNLTDLEEFLTTNHSKLVYREKTQIRFTYDGNKQKRILQRMPIDSIEVFAQHGVIPQDYTSNIVITDGSAEYQEAFEQYQLALAEYNNIRMAYQSELSQYNAAALIYNNKIEEYQNRVNAYNEQLETYESDYAQYVADLETYANEVNQYNIDYEAYQNALADYLLLMEQYTTANNQYQIDLAAYEDLMDIYANDFAQYQLDLEEYNNPSDPDNPTITEEPVAPVMPIAPDEPIEPTEPTEPTAPIEPTEPVAPVVPEDTTVDLIEPVAPTRPPEMDAPAPTPPEQPEGGIETEMNPDANIPEAKRIISDNGIYALIKIPHKESSANTTGNDLIMLISNVGSLPDDFISISDTNFIQGKAFNLRNATVSIFQGYQITDQVLHREVEDESNPGESIQIPVNTKKAVHLNRVWGKYLAESYRNCFVSDQSFTWRFSDVLYAGGNRTYGDGNLTVSIQQTDTCNTLTVASNNYTGATDPIYLMNWNGSTWSGNLAKDTRVMHYGVFVNQAVVDIIDLINSKEINEEIPIWSSIVGQKWFASAATNTTFRDKQRITAVTIIKFMLNQTWLSDAHKNSVAQILRELNIDENLIGRALKCIIPMTVTNSSWTMNLDSDSNILTMKNETPVRLYSRFRMSRNNPTNEQLYILLPRYLNRSLIDQPLGNHYLEPVVPNPPTTPQTTGDYSSQSDTFRILGSTSGVSFTRTQDVLNGELINYNSNKLRIYDYTAISVGLPGSGADMEVDVTHTVDYIDSIQAQIKLPNQF